MNIIGFRRFFENPFIERKFRLEANSRYKVKATIEIVKKYEELKYKKLESERMKNGKQTYYDACISVLEWVLNADKKSK